MTRLTFTAPHTLCPLAFALQLLPTPGKFVLITKGNRPEFCLQIGPYGSAHQITKVLKLNTHVSSVWQTSRIKSSFPLQCYSNIYEETAAQPKDMTVMAHDSRPRDAADYMISERTNSTIPRPRSRMKRYVAG